MVKDNYTILEIEEYFKKMIVNHNKLYIRYVFQSNFLIRFFEYCYTRQKIDVIILYYF